MLLAVSECPAGLKTYGYGAVEWAGDIGGDILYNRFGIYNPEKTGGQAAAEITVGTGKSIIGLGNFVLDNAQKGGEFMANSTRGTLQGTWDFWSPF